MVHITVVARFWFQNARAHVYTCDMRWMPALALALEPINVAAQKNSTFDAHVHLDKYGDKLPTALEQIRSLSIHTLAVSMDIPSFQETRRISEAEPLVVPAFGVHPWEAY